MKKLIIIATVAVGLFSCGGSTRLGNQAYNYQSTNDNQEEPITASLFTDKNATISEENIQKILDGTFKLPEKLRVAVVKINSQNARSYWNDEDYVKTQQSYLDLFESNLKKSNKVVSVLSIPDLILGKPQTFTNIREAAVRMQADVVLIYAISTDLYSKYKLFTKADIKAFATTQIVLLDVRTGLVPFSTVVTKDNLSKKQDSDIGNSEAVKRIKNEAVLMTIEELTNKLVSFFNKQ